MLVDKFHVSHTIDVVHRIKYEPKPRPAQLVLRCVNENGERWQLNPIPMNGQSFISINIPKGFLTGNPMDHSQIKIEGDLFY